MLHLLRIDLKKLASYRTFWIVCGLYFFTLGTTTASGMEFLKWLVRMGASFGTEINVSRIPLYHFPDVWQNITFVSGFFKAILAFMVVISITNEFTYRTIRQNVIDGLSRYQFLVSKVLTNILLSAMSVAMVFIIGLVTGMIYSPSIVMAEVVTDLEFFVAYFLEVFAFLSFALLLGVVIQRSGLTIVVLVLSQMIEAIIRANIDDYVPWLIPYFPMESIHNLVPMPFPRYVFMEIQDYVGIPSLLIAGAWTFVFNYLAYLKLKRSDI
ncbi:MAG: ABC transporter permease [Cyclobacteriaceae bacterium]|nr:ABC transporter permease subunit [Cyclobacteriaceae bacterium]MCB0500017.1 ABC transporter permease subunit [Cyclobacteriaceae bacterium]MCB9237165.1 ABC transporter permease subunit [Flammeovirgaceae bacterium]MCO5270874.1 ABC transporter permease [Cyclobacteriaceae bacterium]MCW5901840.1 ABC transporter permease subunit [Cyclobacteriaceae bacterium]